MTLATYAETFRGLQPDWGFDGLGYVVYKRTYARPTEDGTTEEWWQTVQRVVEGVGEIEGGYTEEELQRLYYYIFWLRGTFAGRGLWQLGTDNISRLGGDSLVNCWWTELRRPADFQFLMNQLMLGGGVGFTVQRSLIGELPEVKAVPGGVIHEKTADADYIVPDKREGWTELVRLLLEAYLHGGRGFTYSTLLVRPYGEPIKHFGGTAAGPRPLVEGMEKMQQVLQGRVGRKLRPVDVLDLANIIGWLVVAGNVRRSAEIAIGDPDDLSFLRAKRWDRGDIPHHRAMSNNTVAVRYLDQLPEEFWQGYLSNGEPYGLFNRDLSQLVGRTGEYRPDYTISGVNPCGEVPLAHHESCNLAELFLPRLATYEEARDLALLLYRGQKAIAALPYQDPATERVTHENMRLGLSVTGLAQATPEQRAWLPFLYDDLREFDQRWSRRRGWPQSVRLTTVKPSGTVSLLAGVTPGAHPGFAEYHLRRVRMAADDPLVGWCRDHGYPTEEVRLAGGGVDHSLMIVSFPCRFPAHTWLADQASALDQMRFVRRLQAEWADNAVSCTVYYRPEELPAIRRDLEATWAEKLKSLSFLLQQDHGFDQAPLEALTREQYEELAAGVRPVTPASFAPLPDDRLTPTIECDGAACPAR